jgi:glycosyltransferase involved in cell wall biosynthesis
MTHIRKHIAFATTIPGTVRAFMLPHLTELVKKYDITIYSNFQMDTADDLRILFKDVPIRLIHVAFERKIRPLADLKSWWALFRHLRRDQPTSLHSMMPKTGLVATTAGAIARIPIRIHMFTGQVWASQQGWMRLLLKSLDRLTAWSATHVLADSPSQRDYLIENSFPNRISVLGAGSVSGVDLNRFKPDPVTRKQVRTAYSIGEYDIVFGFLGRMNRDKGVADLLSAFETAQLPTSCHLMLVGPDEENFAQLLGQIKEPAQSRIHMCGHTDRPQDYLTAFDVYCLPSYREGFGTSVIEAAACGVPALVSRIYGLTDAVLENETGLFHQAANVADIAAGLMQLASDSELRHKLGHAARRRVERHYSQGVLVEKMMDFYKKIEI